MLNSKTFIRKLPVSLIKVFSFLSECLDSNNIEAFGCKLYSCNAYWQDNVRVSAEILPELLLSRIQISGGIKNGKRQ